MPDAFAVPLKGISPPAPIVRLPFWLKHPYTEELLSQGTHGAQQSQSHPSQDVTQHCAPSSQQPQPFTDSIVPHGPQQKGEQVSQPPAL